MKPGGGGKSPVVLEGGKEEEGVVWITGFPVVGDDDEDASSVVCITGFSVATAASSAVCITGFFSVISPVGSTSSSAVCITGFPSCALCALCEAESASDTNGTVTA
jgi:hypothetical protein